MEEKIRALLYEPSGLKPLFNPIDVPEELPSPLVIDASFDIANHTSINHRNTEAIRSLLHQANAIVVDNERLSVVMKRYAKGFVVNAPFGHSYQRDKDGAYTLGILNYTEEQQLTNKVLRKFLKTFKAYHIAVFGQPLDWSEKNYTHYEDWDAFCSVIDILMLPGSDAIIPTMTLPLSAMMAKTAVITTPHYQTLGSASGVVVMPSLDPDLWLGWVKRFEENMTRLDGLKAFNAKYASQLSLQSMQAIEKLKAYLS